MKELKEKYAIYEDVWRTIKGYNGSGENATIYANNVIQYTQHWSEVD